MASTCFTSCYNSFLPLVRFSILSAVSIALPLPAPKADTFLSFKADLNSPLPLGLHLPSFLEQIQLICAFDFSQRLAPAVPEATTFFCLKISSHRLPCRLCCSRPARTSRCDIFLEWDFFFMPLDCFLSGKGFFNLLLACISWVAPRGCNGLATFISGRPRLSYPLGKDM